jgi:myo-inositol-1(or 4)-monophosphatase
MKKNLNHDFKKYLRSVLPKVEYIAKKAGVFLKNKQGKIQNIQKKKDLSLVTEADKTSEKMIIDFLQKHFPDFQIIGEETESSAELEKLVYKGSESTKKNSKHIQSNNAIKSKKSKKFTWHIDPLDGTTNFIHGLPHFCVSIGLENENGDIVLGVIHNPISNDTFTAIKNDGARKNGKIIQVSKTNKLKDAMIATGFTYEKARSLDKEMQNLKNVLVKSRAIRRFGSAALDLSYTACGYFDGFWEFSLSSWDVAAGILMVLEAGGVVTNQSGLEYQFHDPCIVATNGFIHNDLLKILK